MYSYETKVAKTSKKKKKRGEHNFVVFPSLLKNITTAIQRQSLLAVGLLTRLMLAVSRRKKKRAGLLLAETRSTDGLLLQKKIASLRLPLVMKKENRAMSSFVLIGVFDLSCD